MRIRRHLERECLFFMSYQPTSGDQWKAVSGGVGTTTVADRETALRSIVVPGTYIGTINFHDSASAAGTTATSSMLILGLPATGIPFELHPNFKCRKGLTYEATGTPLLTFSWD